MARSKSGISIVIPAYNEEKFLPETLSYLRESCRVFASSVHQPVEIIVVNNASTDNTVGVAESFGVRVIHHEIRNIASVRNVGIRAAMYAVVITVDADTFVPKNALTEIWSAMESGRYVGGGVRIALRSNRFFLKLVISVFERLMVLFTGLSGGMFFFERDSALGIGGFPETHLVAEDMTFAKNLSAFGKSKGKKFCNLRSVTIHTFDRKNASFGASVRALYKGSTAFFGAKLEKKDLDYWYNPKR